MEKRFVVCIRTGEFGYWSHYISDQKALGNNPNKGDILTVSDIDNEGWYRFAEFGWKFYHPSNFRPVDMSVGERVCESIERQPIKQLA